MQAARRQLQRAQRAAVVIQAHVRRSFAVRLRQRMTAAVCIQRYNTEEPYTYKLDISLWLARLSEGIVMRFYEPVICPNQ